MSIVQKFLLKDTDIFHKLTNHNIQIDKIPIEYFYFQLDEEIKIIYKKENSEYFCIKKSKDTNDKELILVSKSQYKKAKKNRISQVISKERYSFFAYGVDFYLDMYLKNLSGLTILEAKYSDNAFAELDKTINDLNLKEITEDKDFSDEILALWGNPNFNFNFKQSLLVIKNNPSLKLNFPQYIDAYDCFRLALNQNIFSILNMKNSYLKDVDFKKLTKIKDLFLQNINLLRVSRDLFEKDTHEEILNKTIKIHGEIKERCDIEKYLKYFKKTNSSEKIIESLEFIKINQYSDNILQSDELLDFLMDCEVFLTIEDNFYKDKKNNLKFFIAKYICDKATKIKIELENIDENSENEHIYVIKKELDEFETILNNFEGIFDLKIFSKTHKKLIKINKNLRKLEQKTKLYKTINMYNKGEMNKQLERHRKNISIDIFKYRDNFFDKKDSIIANLGKIENLIEIYC